MEAEKPTKTSMNGPAPRFILAALLFISIFLVSGLLGRDPWKQDEIYSFGIIYNFYVSHTWLVPTNAGIAFLEKPPLYYWTAVLFMRAFDGVLPLHDAARLASLFYMLVSLAAVAASARIVFHDRPDAARRAWITLLLFLGSLGLVRHAHDMFTDVGLLAGAAVATLGIAILVCFPRRWILSGFFTGLGTGMAFLCKGFLVPAVFAAAFMLLILACRQLKTRDMLKSIGVAAIIASPFLLLWPWALYRFSPALFMQWFWNNNIGRFLGFSVNKLGADNEPGYILWAAVWFAFPVFPLAMITIWRNRTQWRMPEYLVPVAISAIGMALLLASASARALYLMPLLPAFSLLGVQAFMNLPARPLQAWNNIQPLIIIPAVVLTLAGWFCLTHPLAVKILSTFYGRWLPLGFMPEHPQVAAFTAAGMALLLWILSMRPQPDLYLATSYRWLTLIGLLWILPNTLLLPWINEIRSFRSAIVDLNGFLKTHSSKEECISRYHLGENEAPIWQYLGEGRGMGPYHDFDNSYCPLLLDVSSTSVPVSDDKRWHLVWRGSRPIDNKDEFRLYRRN